MKDSLALSQEEYFTLLRSVSNGDLSALTSEIINEAIKPYLIKVFDIPEFIELMEKMEIEFENIRGKPIANMEKLLKYMDRINDIFEPYKPCKKKCPNCCFIPVKVSGLEVIMIEKFLCKNNFSDYKKKEYILKDMLKKTNYTIWGEEYNGKKCPFLKSDECTIYSVRPYVCRRYIIFENDNKKCGYNNNENVCQFTSTVTETSYENVIKYYLIKNPKPKNDKVMFGDIREYFSEG
jgi:Fe-S-cluster containining protein